MFCNSKNLFRKLIYSSEIGFLSYEISYSRTIISKIGGAGTFWPLYYYFKSNLDNFENFGNTEKGLGGAGRSSPPNGDEWHKLKKECTK